MIGIELLSVAFLAIAIAMLWFAKPKNGQKAAFLRREPIEILYTLAILFLTTGGLGGMLLGAIG